jgi:cyclohexa-1,5-dienecarbonyl-CoA hydratase
MTTIQLDINEHVARVTLNMPPHNIVTIAGARELAGVLASLKHQAGVKVVVLGAQGRSFCAGVDVADHTADKVDEMIGSFHSVFNQLWGMPQPTIAAVQGAALGGGMELALGCDLIVASDRARFGQPEIKLGVFPPIAALLLPSIVGRGRALQMILTGETIGAAQAKEIGLVQAVAPEAEFEGQVNALVGQLRAQSGAALRLAKRATLVGLDGERHMALKAIERIYLRDLMQTADAQEGIAAFMQKRAPAWSDR